MAVDGPDVGVSAVLGSTHRSFPLSLSPRRGGNGQGGTAANDGARSLVGEDTPASRIVLVQTLQRLTEVPSPPSICWPITAIAR